MEEVVDALLAPEAVIPDERTVPLGRLGVVDRDPVHALRREELQPALELAVVEEPGLQAEELLGLRAGDRLRRDRHHARSLGSSMSCFQRRQKARCGVSPEGVPSYSPASLRRSESMPRSRISQSTAEASRPCWLRAKISTSSGIP